MSLYLILATASILLLVYYIYSLQPRVRNLPPGPFVVPIVGSIPAIIMARKPSLNLTKVRPWEYIQMLSKEFGDLFSACVLNFDAVVLTSYELITEVANTEEYSMKFAHKLFTYPRTFGKEMGLIFAASTPLWTEMRRFTVRTLREFGFGKRYSMHSVITEETSVLIEQMKKKMRETGGVIKFRNTFSLSVLNMLWCMVAGIRYDHDDERLQNLLQSTFKMSKLMTFGNPLEAFVPFIGRFLPKSLGVNHRSKTIEECNELSKRLLEERKAEGYYLTDPQNYIDVFLKKIHENKDVKDTLYTEHQLQSMIIDLLMVGTLTLNGTLSYGILFLVQNPEIQRRLQDEIDSIVPRHMVPTDDNIKQMPYFQAFMLETHRLANVVPNPVPRLAPKDWNLRGYKIPKGTVIFSNHYSINMEKEVWGDPHVFRPERFINEKGEFVFNPRVTAFGFGKRICIGIHLVDAMLPLVWSMLLQTFTFSVVPGMETPTPEPEIGVSLSPEEFPVQLTLREKPSKAVQ